MRNKGRQLLPLDQPEGGSTPWPVGISLIQIEEKIANQDAFAGAFPDIADALKKERERSSLQPEQPPHSRGQIPASQIIH